MMVLRKKKTIVYALICLGLFSLVYILPRKIIITDVTCESQNGRCTELLENGVKAFAGSNLIDARNGVSQFLTDEVLGKDVILRYRYPSTLSVYVTEAQPMYAIANIDQTDFRLIEKNGYIVSSQSNTDLPFATVSGDLPKVGDQVANTYLFALNLLYDLSKSYQITSGILSEDGLLVPLSSGTNVLFPLEGDRDLLLGSFVLVINQLNTAKTSSTMDKVTLDGKTVDLRFKNPVVR